MKAILEFDLDSPEDRTSHLRCVKSTDMAIVLFEVIYNFRKDIERRGDEGKDPLELFYEKLTESLDENGINIDELIN
jgi:hypothetical protein